MERVTLLGLVLALGILGTADAACDSACQQSCYTKLSACQLAVNEGRSDQTNQTMADMCANIDQMDPCSVYQKLGKCMDTDVPAQCSDDAGLKTAIDQLRAVITQTCDPISENSCSVTMLRCQCKLQSGTGFNLNQFCASGYLPFEECMNTVPSACTQAADTKSGFEMAKNAYNILYYLYCPAQGGCESAMTCLQQLTPPQNAGGFGMMGGSGSTSGQPNPPVPDIMVPTVCGNLTVFDCLKTASSTCKLDQGQTSMDQIKTAFSEMCTQVLPQATSLMNCGPFRNCLQTFKGNSMMTTNFGETPTGEQMRSVGHYIAATTRSGFWCSWGQHIYQCAIDNAQACNLPSNTLTLGQQKLAAMKTACVGAATALPPQERYAGGSTAVRATVGLLSVVALLWALVL